MKRLLTFLVCLCFLISPFNKGVFIYADDEDGEVVYVSDDPQVFCNKKSSEYDENRCTLFLKEQGNSIKEINEAISNARNDFKEAQALASEYATQANSLEAEIDELNVKIEELTVSIEELQTSISEKEGKVEEISSRVKGRMVESQKTMHFNPYLDFILGSRGFEDLLRRIYGINAILSKEKADRESLIDIIKQLEVEKKQLEESKAELDSSKAVLVEKQAEFVVMYNYYLEIMEETEALIEEKQNELEEMRTSYSSVLSISNLSGLVSSEGFLSPAPGSSISARVWYYPASFGGGVHLGIDYAVGYGTRLQAPANGVIVVSYNGCGYGYLGCSCGGDGAGNGVSYGGNQVYLITSVNNRVYAITFSHLKEAVAERGSIVLAGDTIGYVGSSGNSTGPHCHIEMFYLGEGDMVDIETYYLNKDYSTSFNCGWGEAALVNTCENKGSAPCRLDPSQYLGS